MELRGRHRLVQARSDDEIADVRVGFEQHRRGEEHVVDPDDAVLVQLAIVDKGRSAPQREVQRVMKIVIEVGSGRDDEIDEPAIHQLDDAPSEAGRGHGAGDGEADRGVVFGRQHLVGKDCACLRQPAGVEGLEPVIYQQAKVGAAARPVITNRLAGEELATGLPG